MKKIYTFLVCLFVTASLMAQNVEFTKANFSDKKGLKEALNNIKIGDDGFAKGKGMYMEAINSYTKANNFNPNNALLNYKMGVCYLSFDKEKALTFLKKAEDLNPHCAVDLYLQLGIAYHQNHDFEKGMEKYKAHKNKLTPKEYSEIAPTLNKKIQECEVGVELIKKPIKVFIDNLGTSINSLYPEYCPIVNADESMLIYTSRRDNTTGEKRDPQDQKYYEDILIADNAGDDWKVTNPGKPLNSDLHDATVGLSPDGQTLYIYKGENGGDLYECKLKGNEWGKPERMNKNINSKYHESSASLGPDGRTLYFVSDRLDGVGGRDIYVTYLDKKGNWGEPINLKEINTIYDEEAVFIHPDGRTLYFSSQGHKTMGGFDVFKTVYDNGKWSEPQNMGYPINTADDDVFFSITASGLHAFMSSARAGGYGEQDIYLITFLNEKPVVTNSEDNLIAWRTEPVSETVIEQTVSVNNASLTLLKGRILDDDTKKPIEAQIILTDNTKNEELATFTSNSATGKYLVSLPSGKNYGIAVKADGYLFHSENFDIPNAAAYQEIEKDIYLKKVEVGKEIVLKNIFFDFNKATLRPESKGELENLTQLMRDNSTLKIEISGHTDNVGSATYNKTLSDQRAKAVVDYLIKAGISADRMTSVGYGFDKPIASNATDEGRQLNRRTEFKIISK
jgi:outer membrane protein OmpA-like peptidoglycan-associated protein/tetratricopeptide (TPR) repeat protein